MGRIEKVCDTLQDGEFHVVARPSDSKGFNEGIKKVSQGRSLRTQRKKERARGGATLETLDIALLFAELGLFFAELKVVFAELQGIFAELGFDFAELRT